MPSIILSFGGWNEEEFFEMIRPRQFFRPVGRDSDGIEDSKERGRKGSERGHPLGDPFLRRPSRGIPVKRLPGLRFPDMRGNGSGSSQPSRAVVNPAHKWIRTSFSHPNTFIWFPSIYSGLGHRLIILKIIPRSDSSRRVFHPSPEKSVKIAAKRKI